VADQFDPYREWLDIALAEQPADYYRLLGVKAFETDCELIRDRADDRMENVRRYQNGKYAKQSQRILNELSSARSCLLDEKLTKLLSIKKLPELSAPGELLPEVKIPENVDPFSGTANVDQDQDLLEPISPRSIMPYVVSAIGICLLITGIIVLIMFQRPS
jgi:hypothetical protein